MTKPEVGNTLVLQFGYDFLKAKILQETDGRYLLKFDYGMLEVMDIDDLVRRKYIILQKKVPFWKRWRIQ